LIRLPPGLDVLTQRVLGSILLNRIVLMASKRDVQAVATGKLPRVTLYIDEVASFAGKRFTQDLTRVRNWGIAVVAAAQHFKQEPWHTVEGQALYQAMRGNMGTTVLFRVGMDMAFAEADAIFKPRGDLVARVEREVTETAGVSRARGSSASTSSSTATSVSRSQTCSDGTVSSQGEARDAVGMLHGTNIGSTRNDSYQMGNSEGISDSRGSTEGTNYQEGETHSTSVRLRRDFYSVEEQARIHAYTLAGLPARQAYVVLGNDRAEVCRIRTLDVPVDWQTVWGGIDYKEMFLQLAAPPAPVPEPREPLEVRLQAMIDSGGEKGAEVRLLKPRVSRAAGGLSR
jgi:hypothetical protein